MIYRVVLDDTYDLHTSDINCMLLNPSIELEMNAAGSFNFTLPPTHPYWDSIEILKSTIDVYEDDDLIFTGRVANIDKNWNNERVVECEGALAYFNDSVHRQMKWENPLPIASEDPNVHNFLKDILDNHNVFVGDATNRQIHVGHIYVDPYLVTREVDYDTTLDILTRMCIDTNGGYFMVRKDPETHMLYLDWLKDFTEESGQPASFGVNLLDFNTGLHAADICTGVLARGATVNDQVVTLSNVELVDETTYPDMSVDHYTTHDQDILWHRDGMAKFGRVVQVHEFPDAQTDWKNDGQIVGNSLFEEAKKWLEEKNTKVESIEVEVAELSWLREGVPKYKIGQIVEILDDAHMAGESYEVRHLPMYKLSCNLSSGSKKVTLGRPPKKELTQISASNSESSTLSSGNSSGSSSGGGSGSGEECKVHDVRVDGTSVVTDKIANISLTGKADVSTVNALAATVATKADASAVVALADVVSGKQNQIEFNTQEAATEVLTRLKADDKVYNLGGGTEVEANPSDPATDDLETIKIGDTVYDIPGGGGSTNYGKFKCDVLFNTPTTTSAWASPIEICSEEKAKEYDMIYLITRFIDGTSNGFISNSYLVNSIGQTSDSEWLMGIRSNSSWNDTQGFIFLSFDNSKLKFYTNTGNSSTLYKVYGLKFENKLINRSDIYSEEERMIGRWTDGKPIYQKTMSYDFTSSVNDWTFFDDSVSYEKMVAVIPIMTSINSSEDQVMQYGDSETAPRWCIKNDHKIYYYLNNARRKGVVTFQYTKATDTPDSGVIPEDPMFISDPMIYSEEEQVVGSWTDGKPLYQKTVVWDNPTLGRVDNLPHGINNVDHIHILWWKAGIITGIDNTDSNYWGDVWICSDTAIHYRLGPSWGESIKPLIVTFQYTKTTDSVLSGPKKGKIIQRSDIYSEEERLIGRWTDGKPLYQKTVDCGALPNNTTKTVDSGLNNVQVKSMFGYAMESSGWIIPLPFVPAGNINERCMLQFSDTNSIRIYTNSNLSSYASSYITLQYTKTTDAPFSKQLIEDPQFVMMSDIYSEEEQVVGRWTDGKPIYQKTVIVSSGSLSSGTMTVPTTGITDVEKCIDWSCRLHSNSENRDFPIPYDRITYSESVQCLVHVLDDHTIGCTLHSGDRRSYNNIGDICITFKYTKTTDAPGTGPTKGNLIYLPALYSEEEREVGVWTDGKPLYQKTWVKQLPASHDNDNYSFYIDDTSNLNIETQVSASGFLKTSDGSTAALNGGIVDLPGWNYGIHINTTTKILQLYSYHQNTTFGNGVAIITLQYTKTTDQPGSGTFLTDGTPSHHYSTSEKVVGTWIDGSTIYERTIQLTANLVTNDTSWTQVQYDNPVTNMRYLIDCKVLDGTGTYLVERFSSNNQMLSAASKYSGTSWNAGTYMTIQYTKSS